MPPQSASSVISGTTVIYCDSWSVLVAVLASEACARGQGHSSHGHRSPEAMQQPPRQHIGTNTVHAQLVYSMELKSVKPCGQCTSGSKTMFCCAGSCSFEHQSPRSCAPAICSEAFATSGSCRTAPSCCNNTPTHAPGREAQ